jgi:YD repeat-containing protein
MLLCLGKWMSKRTSDFLSTGVQQTGRPQDSRYLRLIAASLLRRITVPRVAIGEAAARTAPRTLPKTEICAFFPHTRSRSSSKWIEDSLQLAAHCSANCCVFGATAGNRGLSFLRLLIAASFSISLAPAAGGQQLFPQNPSTIQGPSTNSVSTATETVNNANGNVIVSIPLISRRGIGGSEFSLSLQYDSKNYDLKGTVAPGIWGGLNWDTTTKFNPDFGLGRLSIPRLSSENLIVETLDDGTTEGASIDCDTNFQFRDVDGSVHSFDNRINCTNPNGSAFPELNRPVVDTLDGSMMRLDISDSTTAKVILENGSVIRFNPTGGYARSITDRFGNQTTFSGDLSTLLTITDSVGRVVTVSNATHRISYKNSDGAATFIDLTTTSTPGTSVSLHAENCHYFGPVQPGGDRANVVASHDLVLNAQQKDTIVLDSQGAARTFTVEVNPLGEIAKVTYPTGGYTRYTFQAFPGAYSVGDFSCGTYGVREIASKNVCDTTSGSCASETTTTYTPTLVNESNSTISVIEPADNVGHQRKVVHDFGGSFSTGTAGMNTFKEIKESIYDNRTTLLKTTETTYTTFVGSNTSEIIWSSHPKDVTVTYYGQGANAVSSTKTHYDYDPIALRDGYTTTSTYPIYFDQPKTISIYGSSGSLLESTSLIWNNSGSFVPDGNHILNLLSTKTVTSQTDGLHLTEEYNYDIAGLLTGGTKSGTGIPSISTGYQVDSAGRITQITDPLSHSTSYGYTNPWFDTNCSVGSSSPQPSTIQNAKGQQTVAKYFSCSGLLASTTDANGATTLYTYDSLDRLKSVAQPDNGGYTMNYGSTQIQKSQILDSRSINMLSVLDGLGETAETKRLSDPACSGSDSHVLMTFDGMRRTASATNPYCNLSDPTYGVNQTDYDALDRPTIVTRPDGSKIQYCYNGLQTDNRQSNCLSQDTASADSTWVDYRDETGRRWQQISDSRGRLTHVAELGTTSSSVHFQTDYGYDGFGNLTSANQLGISGSRTRAFRYDSLSRLTYACNPETLSPGASCDGNTWGAVYQYDLNSNLHTKSDFRGVTITYGYDALNRLLSKTYSGGSAASTRSSCYQYDTALNGAGRLGGEWTQTGACPSSPPNNPETRHTILSYDTVGRITGDQQCHRGRCSSGAATTSAMHYDLVGNLTYYSNGIASIELGQSYDAAGRLQSIGSSLYGPQYPSYPATLLSVGAYSPAGALQNMNLGPVINVTRTYDQRLRVTSQKVTHP